MTEAINLDGFMDTLDVLKAVSDVKGRGARLYRSYANWKVKAMHCRLDGRIDDALRYEQVCERVYQRIPKDLQW